MELLFGILESSKFLGTAWSKQKIKYEFLQVTVKMCIVVTWLTSACPLPVVNQIQTKFGNNGNNIS